MTITVKDLAEKVTAVYHEGSDLEAVMQNIARTAAELLGYEFAPEPKPLPTEPGAVIIATEVLGMAGKWRMIQDDEGDWFSAKRIRGNHWLRPEHITAWTPARVTPEGEPISLGDVEAGDLVRVEQDNGDESTFTVARAAPEFLTSKSNLFYTRHTIRAIHLLHREEA